MPPCAFKETPSGARLACPLGARGARIGTQNKDALPLISEHLAALFHGALKLRLQAPATAVTDRPMLFGRAGCDNGVHMPKTCGENDATGVRRAELIRRLSGKPCAEKRERH